MNLEEAQLEKRYREILIKDPLDETIWINEAPATPFVGNNYGANGLPKVLVYGSAENLTYTSNLTLSAARNRVFFDEGPQGTDKFFPRVHISPITDGSLLTAARYLLEIFEKEGFSTEPKDFLQQIAVSNYGKFSLKGKKNSDYASKPKLLEVSHPYVKADLEVLKPDVVILPRSIYQHSFNGLLINEDLSRPNTWTIYQTNAGVINRHIEKQLNKAGCGGKAHSGWAKDWVGHVQHMRMGRYLDWLDWRVKSKPEWLHGQA